MKSGKLAREEIFKIIKNQMDENDPPMVKITYKRLRTLNYDDEKAMQLIGQCLILELFEVMKHKKTFNETRYLTNLKNLPEKPFHTKAEK
jgi:DNA topoisomerase VI subunit A